MRAEDQAQFEDEGDTELFSHEKVLRMHERELKEFTSQVLAPADVSKIIKAT